MASSWSSIQAWLPYSLCPFLVKRGCWRLFINISRCLLLCMSVTPPLSGGLKTRYISRPVWYEYIYRVITQVFWIHCWGITGVDRSHGWVGWGAKNDCGHCSFYLVVMLSWPRKTNNDNCQTYLKWCWSGIQGKVELKRLKEGSTHKNTQGYIKYWSRIFINICH